MRRDGSRRTSPSCHSCCAVKAIGGKSRILQAAKARQSQLTSQAAKARPTLPARKDKGFFLSRTECAAPPRASRVHENPFRAECGWHAHSGLVLRPFGVYCFF